MSYFTGKGGAINNISCLRRYRVMDLAMPAGGVSSASDGARFLVTGNDDWQAVANAYGAAPATNPGSLFNFTCRDSDTSGLGYTSGADGAYMEMVRVFWDVEGADLLYHELFISGSAALSANDTATDATNPGPVSAMGLDCDIDGNSFDIRRAMLEISCPSVPFVDSGSSSGVVQRMEGNFKASFELEAYTKAALPAKNSLVTFTIDATAAGATTWGLNYVLITEATTEMIKAGPQGRAVGNACKIKGEWSGYLADGTKGYIKLPSGSDIWP